MLEVVNAMLDGDDAPDDAFNLAFMVCIPKEPDCHTHDGQPVYKPSSLRPLSIVDASNRLLASIFRMSLERCIGARISSFQKGFLRSRQMLKNVIEIDWAAHQISLLSGSGAIILFEFTAAFPSLSHEMIWDTLQACGVDRNFINVVRMFYVHN